MRDDSGEPQITQIREATFQRVKLDLVGEEDLPGGTGQSTPTTAIKDRVLAFSLNFLAG
jgi:hypothetical protein